MFFAGDLERLCACGHALEQHAPRKQRGLQPCRSEDGCPCRCFRVARPCKRRQPKGR